MLWTLLTGIFLVLWVPLGGNSPWTWVAGNIIGAFGCLWFVFRPPSVAQGSLRLLSVAFAIMMIEPLFSLVPLPASVLALVSPGTLVAHGDVAWHTIAVFPYDVLDVLSFRLFVGLVALYSCLAVQNTKKRGLDLAMGLLLVLVCVVPLIHLTQGLGLAFGFLKPPESQGVFLPPLVNPNHAAAFAGCLAPYAVVLYSRRRYWVAVAVALVLMVVVASNSVGAAAAVAAGVVCSFVWTTGFRRLSYSLLVLSGLAILFGGIFDQSTVSRWMMWRSTGWMWLDFPLFGAGHGLVEDLLSTYRDQTVALRVHHTHNDWLQWLAQGGVVGAVLGLLALLFSVPRQMSSKVKRRVGGLLFGVAVLFLHSFIDFPLHIPVIVVLAVFLVGAAHGLAAKSERQRMAHIRPVFVVMFFAHLVSGGFAARAGLHADSARDFVRTGFAAEHKWFSPGSSEQRIERAVGQADVELVRSLALNAPRALTAAHSAIWLSQNGEQEAALEVIEHAIERDPNNQGFYEMEAALFVHNADVQSAIRSYAAGICLKTRKRLPPSLEAGLRMVDVLAWLPLFETYDCPKERYILLRNRALGDGRRDAALKVVGVIAKRFPSLESRTLLLTALVQAKEDAKAAGLAAELINDGVLVSHLPKEYAELLLRTGRYDELIEIGKRSDREEVVSLAIRAAGQKGGLEAAKKLHRRVLLLNDDTPQYRYALALIAYQEKQYAQCLELVGGSRMPKAKKLFRKCELQ